jgi:hypothetical protein
MFFVIFVFSWFSCRVGSPNMGDDYTTLMLP